MEKIKLVSNRPLLRFSEVFEQYDVTVEDLFHEALLGNLTIYVQTPPNLKVGRVGSIHSVLFNLISGKVEVGSLTNKEKEEFLCELIPEFKELLEAEEMLQNSGEILNKEKRAALHGKANLLLSNMLAKFGLFPKIGG